MKKLIQQAQWFHYEAPWGFKLLVLLIILFTFFGTCSCTNPLIPDELPIEEKVDIHNGLIITPNDTVHLIPVERAGMKLCSCDGGIAGGETIGVICSNGQFLFLGQHLSNHCMCGNFYVQYWVCKRKKSEI